MDVSSSGSAAASRTFGGSESTVRHMCENVLCVCVSLRPRECEGIPW